MHDQRFSRKIHLALAADPVAHGDKDLILHRLYADLPLKHFHRFCLCIGCRDQDQLRSFEHTGPNTLRQMTVVADHDPDLTERGIKDFKAMLRRSIIILLIELLRLRDMHHLCRIHKPALRIDPKRCVVTFPPLLHVYIRRKVITMLGRFRFQCRDLRGIFRQAILRDLLLFILRKKRRKLDLREKEQIAPRSFLTKGERFFQVVFHAVLHGHLCQCQFHISRLLS